MIRSILKVLPFPSTISLSLKKETSGPVSKKGRKRSFAKKAFSDRPTSWAASGMPSWTAAVLAKASMVSSPMGKNPIQERARCMALPFFRALTACRDRCPGSEMLPLSFTAHAGSPVKSLKEAGEPDPGEAASSSPLAVILARPRTITPSFAADRKAFIPKMWSMRWFFCLFLSVRRIYSSSSARVKAT